MAEEKGNPGVGFDLGTTYSCVAASRNGVSEVISNPEGKSTTPSVVAFLDKEKLVGSEALKQAETTPDHVIFETKRIIGRSMEEPSVKEDIKRWPFQVKSSKEGRLQIICNIDGKSQIYSPEQVGADILRYMKEFAQDYLEIGEIKDCVITVPASFDETQRKATMDAAKIAGLNCLRLINEPTAAAVAYGVIKDVSDGLVLIFDFGGGTFDVTLLEIKEGVYEVKATGGDAHCGSKDLDNKLVAHIMEKFNAQRTTPSTKVDINKPENYESKKKLYLAVEETKIALSTKTKHTINVSDFVKGATRSVQLKMEISRVSLEKLAKPLLDTAVDLTSNLLKENKVEVSKLDKIVLVGGFTKMPVLRERLKKMFGDKLSLGINPDEAVAKGAAMMAEVYAAQKSGRQPNLNGLPDLLLDVTSLALGIELENGTMSKIIRKDTPVPCAMEDKYTTSYDNQTAVKIVVYQGNRPFTKDNKKLGSFKFEGIPKLPKGEAVITVKFKLSAEGMLSVTAHEASGMQKEIVISKDKVVGLSKEELDRMVNEAEIHAEEDRKKKEILLEKEKLERLINECEDIASENELVADSVKQISEWMNSDEDKEACDFADKMKMLSGVVKNTQ